MSKRRIEEIVTTLLAGVLEGTEIELVDVTYVHEQGHWILRVLLDKPGGIEVDDCQAVSTKLEPLLDEENPIPGSYMLEVSSPGVERPLTKEQDFIRYLGHKVQVRCFAPVEGRKRFRGILQDCSEGAAFVECQDGLWRIPLDMVAKARLVADF